MVWVYVVACFQLVSPVHHRAVCDDQIKVFSHSYLAGSPRHIQEVRHDDTGTHKAGELKRVYLGVYPHIPTQDFYKAFLGRCGHSGDGEASAGLEGVFIAPEGQGSLHLGREVMPLGIQSGNFRQLFTRIEPHFQPFKLKHNHLPFFILKPFREEIRVIPDENLLGEDLSTFGYIYEGGFYNIGDGQFNNVALVYNFRGTALVRIHPSTSISSFRF